jgi:hypothetical protein
MTRWWLMARFFCIVPPVPVPLLLLLSAATTAAAVLALVSPALTTAPLAAVLVLQIFAASSGVAGPSRRGYYDTLFAQGIGRAQLLCGHWLASAGPGAVCWWAVAALERLGPGTGVATAPGSLLALWLTSSVPWAITAALPRFSAAIAWLVALVTALSTVPGGQVALQSALTATSGSAWGGVAALVYPMGLLGVSLTGPHWVAVAIPGLLASALLCAAAFGWFIRTDLPLEVAQ